MPNTTPVDALSTTQPNPLNIFTEAAQARTTNGQTANQTLPAGATRMFVGINITGFAGGTNVQYFVEQQDANGIFQPIASTATLTQTGPANLSIGESQTNQAVITGAPWRIRWVVTGVFTTLNVQFGVTVR